MAGYTATGRIRRVVVHARPTSVGPAAMGPAALARPTTRLAASPAEVVDLARRERDGWDEVRDRLHDVVAALDQLTWYLRSPDSWR